MAEVLLVNPRRRKKKTSTRKRKTTTRKRRTYRRNPVAANPVRRRRRRTTTKRRTYRRNPSPRFSIKGFMQNTMMPSAVGAVGALGVDMLMGVLPLPANLKTGPIRPLVKGVGAVGVGLVANMVASRKIAEQITAGGLTVVLYDTMKTFLKDRFPALPMGEYDDSEYPLLEYVSPAPTMGEYLENDMSAYVDDEDLMGIDDELGSIDMDEEIGAYVEDEF